MADVTSNLSALSKGVTGFARDAAYVAVGLGVMSLQRAQVRRVELQRRLASDLELDQRFGDIRDGAVKGMARLDSAAKGMARLDVAGTAMQRVGTTLHPLEEKFPSSVTALSAAVRDQARGVRIRIRRGPRP